MKSSIIFLIGVLLSGCLTTDSIGVQQPLVKATVQLAVAQVINNQSDTQETANRIITIISEAQKLISPDEEVNIERLRHFVNSRIRWTSLSEIDQVRVRSLTNLVVSELKNTINQSLLSKDQAFIAHTLLGYIIETAELFGGSHGR